MPRSTSSFAVPRSKRPALSPARPSSSCFLNISTPVTTVLRVSRKPTISTSSPTFTLPRSMRPVTTVPRPDREDIFNRHQERLFNLTLRYRHILVHRLHQLVNLLLPFGFAIQRAQRGKPHHRNLVSRKLIALQ